MAKEVTREKVCPRCGELKHNGEYYTDDSKPDSLSTFCKVCHREDVNERAAEKKERKKRQAKSKEDLIHQIESGEFEVDQKWLLMELIEQYKGDAKDKLKCLEMIMRVSGYNEKNTDERAIMDSLLESLNEPGDKEREPTGLSDS